MAAALVAVFVLALLLGGRGSWVLALAATLSLAALFSMGKLAGLQAGVDFRLTVSCYQADDAGSACGICDACRIRRAGFAAACIDDPTRYLQHA